MMSRTKQHSNGYKFNMVNSFSQSSFCPITLPCSAQSYLKLLTATKCLFGPRFKLDLPPDFQSLVLKKTVLFSCERSPKFSSLETLKTSFSQELCSSNVPKMKFVLWPTIFNRKQTNFVENSTMGWMNVTKVVRKPV